MRLWPTRRREGSNLDMKDVSITPQIDSFNATLYDTAQLLGLPWTPRMVDRIWVVNRCMQLTCQQIASMPLRFFGKRDAPAWVANPDPAWYPNGIGDAVFAAAWSMYGWGDAFLYITARYADGFPAAWTVLDPAVLNIKQQRGRRAYYVRDTEIDSDSV